MIVIFNDVFIDVSRLKQLKSLSDSTREETLAIINNRYPEALEYISEEFLDKFIVSLKEQLSLEFQNEFKDFYDNVVLLLNECRKIDEDKFLEILCIILFNNQKEIFLAQQNIGLKIDTLPNQNSPRILVLNDLQNLYTLIYESLAKYMFQFYALLCSQIKGNLRTDILNWKIRDCVNYINSTSAGSYRILTKYYDPVIRNACAHESVKYNNIDNLITFTDRNETRVITGEEFVNMIYSFKQSLDQGCLAFKFYLCNNFESMENLLIKMYTINKNEAINFLIKDYIFSLFHQDKKKYIMFDNIHLEKIVFNKNNLIINIKAPKIVPSKLKDYTIYLVKSFIPPLFIANKLFKMDIQRIRFEIQSEKNIVKYIIPLVNLECLYLGIYPPSPNIYYVSRKKKKR